MLHAVPALLASLDPTLPPVRTHLADLAALIPPQQFYRYSDSFSRSIQQASYIIVLRVFLEREDVPTKEEVAQQLGSAFLVTWCSARLIYLTELDSCAQSRKHGKTTSSSRQRSTFTA